jgi:uncharacterized protein YndB with AHSA1/START domain
MSVTFTTAVYIEAPPAEVYAAITDIDSWKNWMPGLIRIEKLSTGPFGPGTRWRETRKMFGKEATEEFEVTRAQPPKRIDLRVDGSKGTTGRGEFLFTYDFVPDRNGTNVELAGEIRMGNPLFNALGRLTRGRFKKASHKDLEAFKAHLEKAPASTAASVSRMS